MYNLLECTEIITKASSYAIERISAIHKFGFVKSEFQLIGGRDGYSYNGYWTIKNNTNSELQSILE